MIELAENLSLRTYRLAAKYSATRLNALEDTRSLAAEFEEAADKFGLLEDEEARLALERTQIQGLVETADDAWDDSVTAFRRRLLDMSGSNVDAPLYRRLFADIPSHVTSLSYAAEALISRELEAQLASEETPELREFSERLALKRQGLEAVLKEQTRMEVEEARFQNRVVLAKAILNRIRRLSHAKLLEIASRSDRPVDWPDRFFRGPHEVWLDSAHKSDEVAPPPALESLSSSSIVS